MTADKTQETYTLLPNIKRKTDRLTKITRLRAPTKESCLFFDKSGFMKKYNKCEIL